MTNSKIIYQAAQAYGFTAQQLDELTRANNGDLPFHTIPEWSRRGFHVKTGEQPLFECYLWKHTDKPGADAVKAAQDAGEDAPESDPHFYKKLSHIYGIIQVTKNAPAADLETIKAQFSDRPGLVLTVKGEKTGAPNVWLTGDTAAYADEIEAAGGIWSNKKSAYYIKPGTAQAGDKTPAPAPDHKTQQAAPADKTPAPVPAYRTPDAPKPWKRCTVYTLRRDKTDTAATVHTADGFTDGLFTYYALGDKSKTWHAVHPVYGLSVASATTRKAAQAQALENLDRIRKAEAAPTEQVQKFAAMVKAAREETDGYTLDA